MMGRSGAGSLAEDDGVALGNGLSCGDSSAEEGG